MKAIVSRILICLALLGTSSLKAVETLSIAAASDLVYALEELDKEFLKTHPHVELKAATGSSGNFFAQIKNGAPYDVFLSADIQYPQALIQAGKAEKPTLMVYAAGRLALWTTRPDVDVRKGIKILESGAVKKFAIANPDHAPYGRAAKAALQKENLWDRLQSKIVLGENIAATAQYVETGNADAGLVALSLLLSPRLAKVGRYVEIPEDEHPRLEQAAIVTQKGAANPQAKAYLDFLSGSAARQIFDRYGFRLPK